MFRKFFHCISLGFLFAMVAAPAHAASKQKIRYCQGGRFQPCVCYQDVSKDVSYRPTYKGCGGNAAILTRGKYLNIFSVVVRDSENRDRWPVSGFGGCGFAVANSESPPNKCSAFKVQKTYFEESDNTEQRVNCLGAKGTSSLFKDVRRMTAKLADVPGTNKDPLVRWCLKSPKSPLN